MKALYKNDRAYTVARANDLHCHGFLSEQRGPRQRRSRLTYLTLVKMKNPILIFSVLLNLALAAGLLFKTISPEAEGGQYLKKSDFTAMLSDVIAGSLGKHKPMFYRFSVFQKGIEEPLAVVEYRNRKETIPIGARDIENGITWMPDSNDVRFMTPEVEVIIKSIK